MAKYVIRQHQFGYNDECYYISCSDIYKVFDSKDEAEKALNELQVKHIRNVELHEHESLWDARQGDLDELENFVKEKTGKSLFPDGTPQYDDRVPKELADNDVLELGRMADIEGYQLVTFENEPVFYAIWLFEDEDWHPSEYEYRSSLAYEESRDDIIEELGNAAYFNWNEHEISGTADSLSDSPTMLSSLVQKTEGFDFVTTNGDTCLRLDSNDGKALSALNELLKQPLFEIRELTIEEVIEIQDEMAKNVDWY